MITCLPDPVSPIATFCAELIKRLDEYTPPVKLMDEKDVELHLLEPVLDSMKLLESMEVFPHPWGRSRELERRWHWIKQTQCAEVYGTRHTADMYLRAKGTRGVSIDAKLVNIVSNRMPNGALQTLLGQCLLASTSHDFSIGLFAHYGKLNEVRWARDTRAFDLFLAQTGIYVIRKHLGPARGALQDARPVG